MPITTTIDHLRGIVVQEIKGEVRVSEVVEAQRGLYLNPKHDPSMPVLWDSRNATASPRSSEEMEEMVARSRSLWSKMGAGRTAILVGSRVDYGMGHMYQTLASRMPRQLKVFEDHAEAIAWLLDRPVERAKRIEDEDTAEYETPIEGR